MQACGLHHEKEYGKCQVLFILGNSALLIGGPGSGSVTKLANQVIVNNTIAVVSEAFVLATKAGAVSDDHSVGSVRLERIPAGCSVRNETWKTD